jgi:CRISPR-associated protein (TIGR02584 family)
MLNNVSRKKTILLCVAGGTPAIITETLWALHEKGERIDEIRIITTLEGRDKILTGKINGRGATDESLLDSEHGQFSKFLRDFPQADPLKFDVNCLYLLTKRNTGVPNPRDDDKDRLTDILSDEDNEKAANQICEIVRELAADEKVRIHASIAGGRKTMGLYLMTAMQLYGKEVEAGAPKFFYKPPLSAPVLDPQSNPKKKKDGAPLTTDDVEIFLADIPFIRLRGIGSELLNKTVEGYDKIVQHAQENLERFNLVINLQSGAIKVGNRHAVLTGTDFFVYVMFAWLRQSKRSGATGLPLKQISLADFDQVCRLISNARGQECNYQDFSFLREDALQNLNYWLYQERLPNLPEVDAMAMVKKTVGDSISAIRGTLKKATIQSEFFIVNSQKDKRNTEPQYGLQMEPARIMFV